jgi:hypothetical protein
MAIPNQSTPLPPATLKEALTAKTAQMLVGQLGIAGFMFAVKTETSSEDKVEVTKNWVQSGAFINDHTVMPPSRVSLRGRVSENEYRVSKFLEAVTSVGKAVGVVTTFLPTLTNVGKSIHKSATVDNQTINASRLLSSLYTNSFNIYGAVQQLLTLSKNQGRVYAFFRALQESRTIVSVIMPNNFYPALIITKLRVVSPQASNAWCDMEVDLEEYRSYQLTQLTTPYVPQNTAKGLQNSMSGLTNKGQTNGVTNPRDRSFLYLGTRR